MRHLRFIVTLSVLAPLALPQQPAGPDKPVEWRLKESRVAVPNAASQAIQSGAIGTIAGNGTYGFSDGGGQAVNAQINTAYAVATDSRGIVYIADTLNHLVRKVGTDGTITTVAGTGQEGFSGDFGPGSSAMIAFPRGLATDSKGNLYIADSGNFCVRRLAPDGTITTFAGTGTDGFSGDGNSATAAQMRMPRGLATDSAGNVYIADSWNYRIRRVDSNGVIQTIAGTGENGYTGDGGKATAAALGFVQAVAVDNSLNIFVSDALNHVVRRISAAGIIQTVAGNGSGGWAGDGGSGTAAQLNYPRGLALDAVGSLYIADSANNRIRQVSASGTIKTVAGTGDAGFGGDFQSASSAKLNYPYGLAAFSGNLYVGDLRNYRIRQANFSASLPLTITTTTPLPQGPVGVSYSCTLAAAGGSPNYAWSISSGTLPSGLTLSSAGVIAGTPATAGSSTFTVRVTDSVSTIAIQTFSLTITSASSFAITSGPVLLSGFVGGVYSQVLTAAGGSPPYTWTTAAGALPPGLAISASGTITGTPTGAGVFAFTIQATDSASAAATKASTLTVVAGGSLARAGVLSHIVSGGGWKTTITLVNLSSSPVPVRILFRADDGSSLTLPLTATQQSASQAATASSLDRVVNPNATLLIETEAPQTSATLQGWADIMTSGPINGFAIFRQASQNGTASEGTVPLQNQLQGAMILPYDNTGGFVMGVAVVNLGASSSVTATIWDDSGSQLGVQTITIPPNGHAAFVLSDKLPLTIGKRGIVAFQSAGGIAGLGLRFSPFGTFTSVPTLPGQ
jgi:hypothetical protein